jgi:hypothetical protein
VYRDPVEYHVYLNPIRNAVGLTTKTNGGQSITSCINKLIVALAGA